MRPLSCLEDAGNQSVQKGKYGGLAVAAAVPVAAAAEGKKQAGSTTALQPGAWEELTTCLFADAAQQADSLDNPNT